MKTRVLIIFSFLLLIIFLLTFCSKKANKIETPCESYSNLLLKTLPMFKSGFYKFDNLIDSKKYNNKKLINFFNDLKINYSKNNEELFDNFLFYSEFDEGNKLVLISFNIFIDEYYFYEIIIKFSKSNIDGYISMPLKKRKSIFEQIMNINDYCIIQIKINFNAELKRLKDIGNTESFKTLVKKRDEIIKLNEGK